MKHVICAFAVVVFGVTVATAEPIFGSAKVIDGDTLYVGNTKVRLQGIDAPERNKFGGSFATQTLRSVIGLSRVRCELTGETTYDRKVGVCTNSNGQDLAAEVIRAGAALDCARYSGGRYRSLEPHDVRAKLNQARYC